MKAQSLFEDQRMGIRDAISLTADSLRAYGERYQHWVAAFSGGKDSSATVTVIAYLIKTGVIPPPKSFSVLYSDTRMELTPLQVAAMQIMQELRERGIDAKVVMPEMDDRFFVYMFGRGVPPPSNTFRWERKVVAIVLFYGKIVKPREMLVTPHAAIHNQTCIGGLVMPEQSKPSLYLSQDEPLKRCSKCRLLLPVSKFHKNRKERSGLRPECKSCRQHFNEVNAEALREKRRAWYAANSEGIKSQIYSYRQAHPDRFSETKRRYAERNRESIAAKQRAWREANTERMREYDRQYREIHREEKREYERQYRAHHPAWDKSKKHTRRAAKANGGRFTPEQWKSLCATYGLTCLCCGKCEPEIKLTPDHVMPLARGGSNAIENIQPLCGRCNSRKGAKTVDYRS